MKKSIFLFAFVLISLVSIQATPDLTKKDPKEVKMECSGQFNYEGRSYTITLHDASMWDCVRFKLASWFN